MVEEREQFLPLDDEAKVRRIQDEHHGIMGLYTSKIPWRSGHAS